MVSLLMNKQILYRNIDKALATTSKAIQKL